MLRAVCLVLVSLLLAAVFAPHYTQADDRVGIVIVFTRIRSLCLVFYKEHLILKKR